MDLAEMKVQKVMVLSDPRLARLKPVDTVLQSLRDNGITHALFDRVRVEPNDVSFREAIEFATEGGFDAFAAVGGARPSTPPRRPTSTPLTRRTSSTTSTLPSARESRSRVRSSRSSPSPPPPARGARPPGLPSSTTAPSTRRPASPIDG
jgi:iron-containing alcohol dehydrogenase-like protein